MQDFKESNSDTVAMIVLEGQQPLGDDAHKYYDRLIRQLKDDPKHVQHIQNFWGDPLTAGAAQSADGKAAYVQVNLAGRPGLDLGERIDRSRPGHRGADASAAGGQGVCHRPRGDRCGYEPEWRQDVSSKFTAVSLAVIFITLLLVYRSVITVILLLLMVGIELQVARGIVAFLGDHQTCWSYYLRR